MQPLRFVHAADLHFDSPVKGLSSRDERVGQRVRDAGYQALQNLVRLCLAERVDFLLIAGDLYDGAVRSPQAQLRLKSCLTELAEAGIQTFIVHGNHDPLDGRFSSITWPDEVHVFGPEPSWAGAMRDGQPIARIQGVSYPQRDVTDNLAARFSPPPDHGVFCIGLLHCNLGANPAHPNYAPCSMDDLRAAEIDYWALGHIHKKQVIQELTTTVVYPGNIQGRDIGEPGERGCYLVAVSESGEVNLDFRPLDVVRWDAREAPIDGLAGIDQLRDRVLDALDDSLRQSDGRDLICRLTLTGRGPLHADLSDPGDLEGFIIEVREGLEGASPWVWLERIENRTGIEIDIDARAAQDDFLGNALARVSEMSPDELAGILRPVHSGRRDGLPRLPEAELLSITADARRELVGLLERAGAD